MAIGITLNVTCFNQTSTTLAFQPDPAVHGNAPTSQPNSLGPDGKALVTATPIDPVFGPSPEGAFQWVLAGSSDSFVFTYDLHDTPASIRAASIPSGYSVPTCEVDGDGNATVVMAPAS